MPSDRWVIEQVPCVRLVISIPLVIVGWCRPFPKLHGLRRSVSLANEVHLTFFLGTKSGDGDACCGVAGLSFSWCLGLIDIGIHLPSTSRSVSPSP